MFLDNTHGVPLKNFQECIEVMSSDIPKPQYAGVFLATEAVQECCTNYNMRLEQKTPPHVTTWHPATCPAEDFSSYYGTVVSVAVNRTAITDAGSAFGVKLSGDVPYRNGSPQHITLSVEGSITTNGKSRAANAADVGRLLDAPTSTCTPIEPSPVLQGVFLYTL
jgi:hypothetical protein